MNYHFIKNGNEDHVYGFEAVLERIIANPEGIEIESGYSEYSENELQFAQSVIFFMVSVKCQYEETEPISNNMEEVMN